MDARARVDALERDGCRRLTDNLGNVRRDDAFRRGAGRVRDDVRHALGRGWVSLAVGRVARVATAAREANLCLDAGDGRGRRRAEVVSDVWRPPLLVRERKSGEGRDAGVRVCCPLVGSPSDSSVNASRRDHGSASEFASRRKRLAKKIGKSVARRRRRGEAGDPFAKNAVRVIQMLTVLNILHAPHMVIFAICPRCTRSEAVDCSSRGDLTSSGGTACGRNQRGSREDRVQEMGGVSDVAKELIEGAATSWYGSVRIVHACEEAEAEVDRTSPRRSSTGTTRTRCSRGGGLVPHVAEI